MRAKRPLGARHRAGFAARPLSVCSPTLRREFGRRAGFEAAAGLFPDGVIGVIVGRALYEGTMDLAGANAAADRIA